MKKIIKNNVSWVGKVDWELKKFHGDEFTTNHGSTYNAYLIQEEKNVLIDSVWIPCLLYTSPSPRDGLLSRMPSSA